MATAAQIVTLACQIAKCPGYTSQAGILLNAILIELYQNFDFEETMGVDTFQFTGSSGPYAMDDEYLRMKFGNAYYTISGVKYRMDQIPYSKYQILVQTAGLNSYPQWFATDPSQDPIDMYVWPPPSGAFDVTLNFYRKMPEITTPESSTDVPWFPNQTYLVRRLAGELMAITNDDRMNGYLGDDDQAYPQGAGTLLRKFLRMKNDQEGYAKTVALDPIRFSKPWNRIPNTKLIGW